MIRSLPVILVSLGAAAGAVGCNRFLMGDKLSENPNRPAAATRDQLFVGVQAFQFAEQESSIPLVVCMWMQQCTGTGVRFVSVLGSYGVKETDFSTNFSGVYTGGGLVDLRSIQRSAQADGDQVYLGVAKTWEALVVGTAADVWGSIPYTQAVASAAQPDTDFQSVVYDSVQALLTQAIGELGGPGNGPGVNDLIYGGNTTKWREVANTLKARFFLHTVEAAANRAAVYDSVVKYASIGISSPANDFQTYHSGIPSERNLWFQFFQTTFGSDLVAGKPLVKVMKARNDPRLPQYFGKNTFGEYGGVDVNNPTTPSDSISVLNGTRNAPDFRQPIITYIENELILAEAYLFATIPNQVQALAHLNNARGAVPLPMLVGIVQPALFDSVMTEKYISMFQTNEVWNDYKRTCIPGPIVLTPVSGASVGDGLIPGRLFYGSDERNVNSHIPEPSAQGLHPGFRNPNDPNPCP